MPRAPRAGEDDERRRYYRITPFGSAVARAETRRLTAAGQAGARQRVRAGEASDAPLPRAAAPATPPRSGRVRRRDVRALRAARRAGPSGLGPRSRCGWARSPTCFPTPRAHADILRQDLRYAARSLRRSPGIRADGRPGRGARHRRHHGDLLDPRPRPAPPAAVSRVGAAGEALAGRSFRGYSADGARRPPTTATGSG